MLWVLLFGYLMVVFSFVNDKRDHLNFSGVSIKIKDSINSGFVSNSDVMRIIKKKYPEILGQPISTLNKEILEGLIDIIPFVKKSEVYNSLSGKLVVEIKQRQPIVRILSGEGYYIDSEGKKCPCPPNLRQGFWWFQGL